MAYISENSITPLRKEKFRWLSLLVSWVNWLFIVLLFLSFFSPYVSPDTFWPLAFIGLLQPLFVFINFLFLLIWILFRKKKFLFSLGILLFTLPHTWKEFNIGSFSKIELKHPVRLMSYNVKLFDLYNWSGNNATRSKMFNLIRSQKPALLCLQEFFHRDSSIYSNLDSILRELGYPYYQVEYTTTKRKEDHWGVVTFSKFPIVNKGKIVFNNRNNNICIYTDVLIGKDTVRLYNMHLQSIAFGKADQKFLEQLHNLEDAEDEIASSKNILRRMKRAYAKRAHQAESVALHMASCRYPIILCGDMNDTPVSYTYRTISSGLTDAFLETGNGFGKSFVNPFPLPRIDYVFVSERFDIGSFRVLRTENLSDHYPILCDLELRK